MVPFSAVIVDAGKTIASQMTSVKNYAQAGSELNNILYSNSAINNDDAFISSLLRWYTSALYITLQSAF